MTTPDGTLIGCTVALAFATIASLVEDYRWRRELSRLERESDRLKAENCRLMARRGSNRLP